jgi:hypothetical protein
MKIYFADIRTDENKTGDEEITDSTAAAYNGFTF